MKTLQGGKGATRDTYLNNEGVAAPAGDREAEQGATEGNVDTANPRDSEVSNSVEVEGSLEVTSLEPQLRKSGRVA